MAWNVACALAAHAEPSLIGEGADPAGDPWKPLTPADASDTGVTRLFEALGVDGNEARLTDIAGWHGSSVENLVKMLKHYLVINPAFADRGGQALERFAQASGIKV